MKPSHSCNYLFILFAAVLMVITACSSDDNTVAATGTNPDTPTDPVEPPPDPTVTAPANLTGIWEGTMTDTKSSIVYDVDMVFYMPEGVTEGHLLGIVAIQASGEPFVLIEAGYDMEPNVNFGYEYYAGAQSSQGTFVKRFEFANNLVGSNKGGEIGLSLSENTLTGDVALDDGSRYDIVLEYSLQNTMDTTLADLEGTWSDASNGWDESSTGVDLTADPAGDISAVATGVSASTCTGTGLAVDISNYNIYVLDFDLSAAGITGMTLSNCDTRVGNVGLPTQFDAEVNGNYSGMAVLVEDDAGSLILKLILSSEKLDPAIATYNEFVFSGAP